VLNIFLVSIAIEVYSGSHELSNENGNMREWSRGLSMRQNGLNPAADVEVDSVTLGVQGAWMGLFALKETRSNCAAPRAYDCYIQLGQELCHLSDGAWGLHR